MKNGVLFVENVHFMCNSRTEVRELLFSEVIQHLILIIILGIEEPCFIKNYPVIGNESIPDIIPANLCKFALPTLLEFLQITGALEFSNL